MTLYRKKVEELKKEIYEKRELISDMEIAGYEDNESQILYRKTKKRIHFLKTKISGLKEGRELTAKEIFTLLEDGDLIKDSCKNVLYPQLKKGFTKT